jgi:hypothetical protein
LFKSRYNHFINIPGLFRRFSKQSLDIFDKSMDDQKSFDIPWI